MKRGPTKTLGEVLEVSRERIEPTEHPNTCFNYVGLESIEGHTGKLLRYQLTSGVEIKSTKNVFHRGEILYGKLRPYLNKVHLATGDGICSTDIYVLRPRQRQIHPSFAAYYLRSPSVLALLSNAMAGANLPRISQESLLSIPVPLPPLAEQERLVKLLDEADELRKLRAQADRRTFDLIPALFYEMFGDPLLNPKGYPVQQLEYVCSKITDGTHQPPPFSDKGIPFLFVRNIVKGYIDFDTEKFITEETFAELTRRAKPELGDILYSTVGSYGVAVQVETDRKFAFQRHIGHLKPDRKKVDSGFLTAQLNTPFLKSQADKSARGVAQKTVNLAEIRNFEVLVPPLSLQKEFAMRVAEIQALEAEQAASRSNLDALLQSLLHRAFSGDL